MPDVGQNDEPGVRDVLQQRLLLSAVEDAVALAPEDEGRRCDRGPPARRWFGNQALKGLESDAGRRLDPSATMDVINAEGSGRYVSPLLPSAASSPPVAGWVCWCAARTRSRPRRRTARC